MWASSGGGSVGILRVNEVNKCYYSHVRIVMYLFFPDVIHLCWQQGKRNDAPPLIHGHASAIYSMQWNPFNDNMLVTADDDGHVKVHLYTLIFVSTL